MRRIVVLMLLMLVLSSCNHEKYLSCKIDELYDYHPEETTFLEHQDFYIDVNVIINKPLSHKPKSGYVNFNYFIKLSAKKLDDYENIILKTDINPDIKKLIYGWRYIDDFFIDSTNSSSKNMRTYTICTQYITAQVGNHDLLDIRTIDYNNIEQLVRQNIVLILEYNDKEDIIRIPKDKINIEIYPLDESYKKSG